MIINWMLASVVFGGIVATGAAFADRAFTASGRPRRWAWAIALGISTAWPLVAGLWALARPIDAPIAIIRTRIGSSAARAIADQLVPSQGWGPAVEKALVALWGVATLLLLLRIAIAIRRMREVTSAADRMTMDGTPVLVSDKAGPAVCGAIAPQIVLPRWILELDAPLRGMVLRHEREHVERGDAATVLGAAIAVALVPWSPATWLMSRRLRLAIELDCDARVLAATDDPTRYGQLLMLVAQRQAHARLQPMLAESSAHLERRITEMHANTKRSRVRAIALGTLAAGAVVLACSSPVMAGITKPAQVVRVAPPLRYANEVLKLPAAKTTVAAPRTPTYQVELQGQGGQAKPAQAPPPGTPKTQQAKPAQFVEFTLAQGAQESPNSSPPKYPDLLKQAGVEGTVQVQWVIDTLGNVVDGTMKVLKSDHALFLQAVKDAQPSLRYTPASIADGRHVKQLIQQEFEFRLDAQGGAVPAMKYDTLVADSKVIRKLSRIVSGKPPER